MNVKTLLAVPVTRCDLPVGAQVRAALAAGADLIELRVDCLDEPGEVARLLEQPHDVPFVLTIRSAEEGGGWDGDESARVALFESLGLKLPGYVDVEYAAWVRSANLRQKLGLVSSPGADGGRPRNRLILSYHDWRSTPDHLDAVVRPLLESPADVVKVVFTAHSATDAWRVLGLLRRHGGSRPLIALATGAAGLLTRVLAPKYGAFLTFAALDAESTAAPGQPTLAELLDVYRWRAIDPDTPVYGVVGWPVGQSRGPLVHNAALAAADMAGVYVPMPVPPDYASFAEFMELLTAQPEFGVRGLSVTMPHKEHALRWLLENGHAVGAGAQRVGAVNTLLRTGAAGWSGENTDTVGLLAALRTVPGLLDDPGCRPHVAVLGAGGVARAAVAALCDAGCRVTVFNRRAVRANQLARSFGCAARPWEERGGADVQVVVNCTSLGMWPNVDETPLPAKALRPGLVVLDTVYHPAETRLAREAAERGGRVVSGVEMFLGQAAAQFELWHRGSAPLDAMRAAL